MMDGGGRAYGSSRISADFDPVVYLKKPEVIARLINWIFSIVVFGCISSQGWNYKLGGNYFCSYNGDSGACGYGTAVGVIAFLGLTVFLILDGIYDTMEDAEHRKGVTFADIVFSGFWSFMWFVCFCLLTDKWRVTPKNFVLSGHSGVEAAIAFSFFSIIGFVVLTVLAVLRYRTGLQDVFLSSGYDPNAFGGSAAAAPYAGGAEQGSAGGGGAYQGSSGGEFAQSPFAPQDPKPPAPGGGYQQQTY